MAQISIPMSNKVGYSMYWSSMWDNKINYSRSLKEDIYLNQFIPLIFNDKISNKILKTLDFNKIDLKNSLMKYNIHIKSYNLDKKNFYKYLKNINKVNFFKSKIWILKFQKWIIIYFFIYLPYFNKFKRKIYKNVFIKKNFKYNNLNNFISLYKKANFKLKYSYKFFNNCFNKNYF